MKISYVILFAFLLICSTGTFSQTASEVNTERKNSIKIITKEKLLSANTIEDLLDSFPKNEYEISYCRISVAGKGIQYSEFGITGNQFSVQVKERIKTLPPKAKLYIEYIKGKLKTGTDNSFRQFPPAAFVIVEN